MTSEDLERLREKLTSWLGATDYVEIRHYTDPERRIGILQAYKSPKPGRTTYCSLGLSTFDWSHRHFPYRVELLTACNGQEPDLARAIATIAFHMEDHDFLSGPGTLLRNAVKIVDAGDLSARLPHVYFALPFPWAMPSPFTKLPSASVAMLYAIPVTDAEAKYWEKKGNDAFEERLEKSGINIFDMRRESCV